MSAFLKRIMNTTPFLNESKYCNLTMYRYRINATNVSETIGGKRISILTPYNNPEDNLFYCISNIYFGANALSNLKVTTFK